MEYLNDEMDDLFRKAGEHYPLKTTDSDWDAVLGRLQPLSGVQSPVAGEVPEKKGRKSRRFFWLLLLLPLGLFSLKYFSGRDENRYVVGIDQAKTLPANKSENNQNANQAADSAAISPNPGHKTSGNMEYSGVPKAAKLKSDYTSSLPHQRDNPLATGQIANPAGSVQQHVFHSGLSAAIPSGDLTQESAFSADLTTDLTTKTQAKDPGPTTDHAPVSEAKTQDSTSSANPSHKDRKSEMPVKPTTQKEKGIYFSLLAGPDLSSVKFQSVKNTGYSLGILIGYRFNKQISLESGVFWDKKQYYSDGKYFNKSKTGIPYSVQIKDLDGNCSMFEVPLSFRYDFSFSRKGRFFSTAGLNTYIMKKENYDYTTDDYPGWSEKVSYNNSSNNLFSILQLSAGYEYGLGKIGRIRIEPYLNIPLKGVGIGSLPISSAGLHLGITIPFR